MTEIKSQQLADLLLQAKFSPQSQRRIQLDACETLIRLIEPGTNYPFEFVCFHMTGYRPRGKAGMKGGCLSYQTLLQCLPAYATQLSRTMKLASTDMGQRVYTVKALAKRFRVCPKTISRWRREGLAGRYMTFPNGRRALGFLSSSVEYFVTENSQKVLSAKKFSQLTDEHRQAIWRRLRRWSDACPDRRQDALRRTSKKFGRSLETIRRLLLEYESQLGDLKLFVKRPAAMTSDERRHVCDRFEAGVSIKKLTSEIGRSRSNIYWAINMARAERLAEAKIEYIMADEFSCTKDQASFLEAPEGLFDEGETFSSPMITMGPGCPGPLQPAGLGSDQSDQKATGFLGSLNSYVQDICRPKVLSAKQERFLFRKYNYLKYDAARLREKISLKYPQAASICMAQLRLREADRLKEFLIRSNLRLVVSVARKHTRDDGEILDLISDGNIAVMNAVEKFDFSRGFKFSTYATWAIVKRFATYRSTAQRQARHIVDEELLELAEDLRVTESNVMAVESARRNLDEIMEETLEEREKIVVREHYGLQRWQDFLTERQPKSFKQIGTVLGLSKERVRQIELAALRKLREVLTGEQFDILTQ